MTFPSITAITCTGGREESFKLCELYMSNQTRQPDEWIVVDDVRIRTKTTMGQKVVRPKPYWKADGPITLGRNLIAALNKVKTELVVIIEDDDVYLPEHIEELTDHLTWGRKHELYVAGECPTMYYHVQMRRWSQCHNKMHASLCATGINSTVIPTLQGICLQADPYYDIPLFEALDEHAYLYDPLYVLGIKGMPGRAGAGNGHKIRPHGTPDPDWTKLHELIGDYAEHYKEYYVPGLE